MACSISFPRLSAAWCSGKSRLFEHVRVIASAPPTLAESSMCLDLTTADSADLAGCQLQQLIADPLVCSASASSPTDSASLGVAVAWAVSSIVAAMLLGVGGCLLWRR